MVLVNITRNARGNQMGNPEAGGNPAAYFRSAQVHGRHLKRLKTSFIEIKRRGFRQKTDVFQRRWVAGSYGNYSNFQNIPPTMPGWQCSGLVAPQEQNQLRPWPLGMKFAQGVDGVAGAGPMHLARIDRHLRAIRKCQLSHGKPVSRRAEGPRLVPGMAGREHDQLIERKPRKCRLDQRKMGIVRRIEGAAEHADTLRPIGQTQSLRTRNLRYRSSSGVPGSVVRL